MPMRRFSYLLLFLLLISAGCIREGTISYEKVELASLQGIDVDKNGLFDISTYYYVPISLSTGKEELVVDRFIYVRPTKFDIYAEGVNGSQELWQARVSTALAKAEEHVEGCRPLYCTSLSSCRGRTEGESLAYLSLSRLLSDFDEAKAALTTALIRFQEDNNTTALATAMARLMVYERAIAEHPAVTYFRGCRVDKEYTHYSPITVVSYTPKAHEALELVVFKAHNMESVAQVSLTETLPFQISERLELLKTTDATIKSRTPLKIAYREIKLTESDIASVGLMVVGPFENEKALFEFWKELSINVRLAVVELPFMDAVMAFLAAVYGYTASFGRPYLALAVAFSSLTLALLIIDTLLSFIISFVNLYILKGYSLRRALKHSIGYVDPAWKRKLAFAALLFMAGFGAEFYAPPLNLEGFSLAELRLALENPIAFLSFLFYFTAIYFLLYVIRDRFRALLGGGISKERVAEGLEKLKKDIEEVKGLLEEMSSEGFDVSEEYELVLAIPLDRMERLLGKNNARLATLLNEYSSRLAEVKAKLENRRKLAQANWEEWEHYIRENLMDKTSLPIDSLIAIPKPWRLWAVTKYLQEHPEEDLYLEGKVIKRELLSKEEKVKRVATHLLGRELKALVVMDEGKVLYASSRPEDYLVKVLLYKIAQHTEGEGLEATFKNSKVYMERRGPYTAIGWGTQAKEGITFLLKRL